MAGRRKTFRIAVALAWSDPASRDVLDGIVRYARGRGWALCDAAAAATADGVIRDPSTPVESGRAIVTVSTLVSDPADVRPDAARIGRMAAEHFLERGFRRFAVAAPAVCRDTFVAAVVAAGRPPPGEASVQHLDAAGEPLAVFAGSDADAAAACRALGLPARTTPWVAVLGVGNDVAQCELNDPPLSSIDVGARRLGQLAAARLDTRLRGRPVDTPTDAPPAGVMVRASTDGLAIADADVAAAVNFIRAHAAAPLRVEEMARATGLDRRTLERRFQKHLGRSPADVLRRYRVDLAAELLRTTARPIADIARACGFQLPQHLAAAFKLQRGQTPSDYRASATLT